MASSERANEAAGSATIATPGAIPPTVAAPGTGAAAVQPGTDERQPGPGDQTRAYTAPGPVAASLTSLRCSCLMNARYHATREAFLDNVHRWFMFAVIMLGAGALLDVFPRAMESHGSVGIKEAFAAGAAIIAALDLTFDLSNRARTHSLMKRRYFELIADLVAGDKTEEQVEACIERFNADEEPAYHALIASSYNAAQEAVYGKEAYSYKIPSHHLFCKNFWRFGGTSYKHSTQSS
jgi:hypothetical protein